MEDKRIDFDESIVEETAGEPEEAAAEEEQETAAEETHSHSGNLEIRDSSEEEEAEETAEDKKKSKKSAKKKKRSVDSLEIALKKKEEENGELKDRFQRLMAEFENARKRTAREQSRMYAVGAKDVLEKLLPVVDNFERGIDMLSEEEKEAPFAQGVIKIYQQLMSTLADIGVSPMDAKGKPFDPEYHNAVMHEENEEMGENLVSEELQKGYMYKDQVLRHSMVKVVN
ncbi:MAG: nucleotide exchange factor GrpE [Eubacterium sp.]|nr:nucleotide exchange factor GrpE [Eubacterium sp.]